MYRNGKVCSIEELSLDLNNAENAHKKEFYFRDTIRVAYPLLKTHNEEVSIQIYVWGKDEKHAVKIVNEIRAQLIALNLWGKISSYGNDTFEEIIAKAKEGFTLLE